MLGLRIQGHKPDESSRAESPKPSANAKVEGGFGFRAFGGLVPCLCRATSLETMRMGAAAWPIR